MRPRIAVLTAALAGCAAGALADDAAPGAPPPAQPQEQTQAQEPTQPQPDAPKVTGDVRAGWRVLSGEGDGRFPQDWGLKDGPRLFGLNLLATDPAARTTFDEAEVHVSGVGDAATDYALTLRRRDLFEVTGSYRRDDLDYRATGDPYSYDTIRERTSIRGLWTPNRDVAIRASWDRDDRQGDAFTGAYYSFDSSSVRQHRLFETVSDRFTLGGDFAVDVFRFGLTQSVVLTDVSDSRRFDAPPGSPAAETTDRKVRAETYATTAKAGVSLLDGKLDSTVFMTRTRLPMDERVSGSQTDDTGAVTPTSGGGELTREALAWRWETSWRPHRDWEVAIAAEREDAADDEQGRYLFGTFVQSGALARVTDRTRRFSADVTWDATDEVRLRLGEQYLREQLFVPTDSHFAVPPADSFRRNRPTDLSSNAWRTTAGADWKPSSRLTLSALTRFTTNERPQTTPVADEADEYSLRARWKATDELSLATLARRTSLAHSGAVRLYDLGHFPDTARGEHAGQRAPLDSATRATSLSQSAAWTHGPWTVSATGTWRRFDTSTDTAWGATDNTLLTFQEVAFRGSDLTANLDVRYALTKTLRLVAAGTRTSTNGDYSARWLTASLGAEYDVAADVTLGATLQSWRFDGKHDGRDDYGVYGVEVSLTYWFR